MSAFEPVELSWGGAPYTIPADKVMGAIARIESTITLMELNQMARTGAIQLVRLASAYAGVLRYAGVKVTDEDVYAGMFEKGQSQAAIMGSINGLLSLMVPPSAVIKAAAKNPVRQGATQTAVTPLSSKPTKRPRARRSKAAGA